MAHEIGTFSYDPAGGEQTIKEMAITQRTEIGAIFLDLSGVTIPLQYRLYNKINGTDYKQIGGDIRPIAGAINLLNSGVDANGVQMISSGILSVDSDIKITAMLQPS